LNFINDFKFLTRSVVQSNI